MQPAIYPRIRSEAEVLCAFGDITGLQQAGALLFRWVLFLETEWKNLQCKFWKEVKLQGLCELETKKSSTSGLWEGLGIDGRLLRLQKQQNRCHWRPCGAKVHSCLLGRFFMRWYKRYALEVVNTNEKEGDSWLNYCQTNGEEGFT